MPWPVYTFRILQMEGAAKTVTYEVPEKHRVIVKFASCRTETGTNQQAFLGVHGIYAWHAVLPGPQTQLHTALMMVAYERETITCVTVGTDIRVIITGYLFSDPDGKPAESRPVDPGRPAPTPLLNTPASRGS